MTNKKTSDKKLEYLAKYEKEKTRSIHLKFNLLTDADILDWLDTRDNKQGYIKELIRQDKNRNQE